RSFLELILGHKWMLKASCRGSDWRIFFPALGEDTTVAKKICQTCPVIDECLEYAMSNGEKFGCWGGTSERERRRLRKTRKRELPSRPVDASVVARLYQEGMGAPAIAEQIGIGPSRVYELLDEAGVKRRARGANGRNRAERA